MKSQSCATAPEFDPMPTIAGPIERAGLTDVPVMLMPTMWIAAKVRPMARPAKPLGHERMGNAEDRLTRNRKVATISKTKAESVVVLAEIARAPAVLSEPAGPARGLPLQD